MSYWTGRERSVSRPSIDEKRQTRSRELSHEEFGSQRRPANTDISSLLQQLREGPVRMIDAVIAELEHQREAIVGESKRMQREMIAYTKLSQSTMASTKEISETLANFAKHDAPAMNELAGVVADQGTRKRPSEEFAERDASRFFEARNDVPLAPEE